MGVCVCARARARVCAFVRVCMSVCVCVAGVCVGLRARACRSGRPFTHTAGVGWASPLASQSRRRCGSGEPTPSRRGRGSEWQRGLMPQPRVPSRTHVDERDQPVPAGRVERARPHGASQACARRRRRYAQWRRGAIYSSGHCSWRPLVPREACVAQSGSRDGPGLIDPLRGTWAGRREDSRAGCCGVLEGYCGSTGQDVGRGYGESELRG